MPKNFDRYEELIRTIGINNLYVGLDGLPGTCTNHKCNNCIFYNDIEEVWKGLIPCDDLQKTNWLYEEVEDQ